MKHILSLGAGVQSSTLALMAAHGEITPMPDCAIFADTQAEPQSVYTWLDWLEPKLPFPLHEVTQGNLGEHALQVRVSGKSGRTYWRALVPTFLRNPSGSRGILRRKCTAEYKVRQIIKQVRKVVGAKEIRAWRKAPADGPLVTQWIGISTDEASRMKPAPEPWIENRWPLIEKGMDREACIKWMVDHGYPRPPKSACYFCPYRSDSGWIKLRDEEPQEFADAVAFDHALRDRAKQCTVTMGVPYLHDSLVPLDQVAFVPDHRGEDQFNNECEGMCGV